MDKQIRPETLNTNPASLDAMQPMKSQNTLLLVSGLSLTATSIFLFLLNLTISEFTPDRDLFFQVLGILIIQIATTGALFISIILVLIAGHRKNFTDKQKRSVSSLIAAIGFLLPMLAQNIGIDSIQLQDSDAILTRISIYIFIASILAACTYSFWSRLASKPSP